MDEKRLLIAAALSFVLLIGWSQIFPPAQPPAVTDAPTEQSSPNAGQPEQGSGFVSNSANPASPYNATDPAAVEPSTLQAQPAPIYADAVGASSAQSYTLENEHFVAVFSNAGARLESFSLIEYTTEGKRLELLPPYTDSATQYLAVDLDDQLLADRINNALFNVKQAGNRLTFNWSDGAGLEVKKSVEIDASDWMWRASVEIIDRGRALPARMVMGPGFGAQEERASRTYYYSNQLIWYTASGVERSAAKCGFLFFTTACREWKAAIKKNKTAPQGGLGGTVLWAGLEDQFFTALAISDEGGSDIRWQTKELTSPAIEGAEEAPTPEPQPLLSVSVPASGIQLYIGPKQYKKLKAYGVGLEETVWFSSKAWLAAIVRTMYGVLQWIHNNTIANWGMAIILATFCLRVMLFPLNQFAMVRMRRTQKDMARIQPKLKAIKAKYAKKKDAASRQKLNEETMALYREEGINPMGGVSGCLPMFIQFPILIGFYNMLTVAVELRGAPFYLWVKDLSQPDPYYLIPIAMGLTMFFQQRMSMSKVTDPVAQQQQKFMMFMPFMFTFFCLQMPAGMVLYWFVNNLLGIGQQWLVNRQTAKTAA
jgi:YidC/Oxa1 family membrane protein insertase